MRHAGVVRIYDQNAMPALLSGGDGWRINPAFTEDHGALGSVATAIKGSLKWPTHIFSEWPFCMSDLQNTFRRYADKTEVDPMKLMLSAGLCALLFAGANLIGGYAQAASSRPIAPQCVAKWKPLALSSTAKVRFSRNPADPRSIKVSDKVIQGHTDQFIESSVSHTNPQCHSREYYGGFA